MTGGYPVEPTDLHASVRHLDCLSDLVKLTDKPFHAYSLGKERNLDALEIVRIGRGVSAEQLEAEPSLFTIINASSPLRYDAPMLQGIIEMSSRNQVVVITPFTLAGAMAPVTIAGALVQQNAEALAGIAFTQLVRPGAPVVYGGFTSNVDMKSGAPAFGTPEYMKAVMAGGQLARRYGLPYRTSNTCAANTLDAQSAYESMMSLWALVQGGGNFIMHAAGWMEGGLTASFEKFVMDVDMLQMVAGVSGPTRHQRRSAGHGCDCGGRARRPLLWHGAHAVALRDRVLLADAFGLAQFRKLEPGGPADDLRSCQQGVEGNTRRL
jgi:trimethylamine--corrinoid protein Co-methyltransferase